MVQKTAGFTSLVFDFTQYALILLNSPKIAYYLAEFSTRYQIFNSPKNLKRDLKILNFSFFVLFMLWNIADVALYVRAQHFSLGLFPDLFLTSILSWIERSGLYICIMIHASLCLFLFKSYNQIKEDVSKFSNFSSERRNKTPFQFFTKI